MWDMQNLMLGILRLIEKRRMIKIDYEFDADSPKSENPHNLEKLKAGNDMGRMKILTEIMAFHSPEMDTPDGKDAVRTILSLLTFYGTHPRAKKTFGRVDDLIIKAWQTEKIRRENERYLNEQGAREGK